MKISKILNLIRERIINLIRRRIGDLEMIKRLDKLVMKMKMKEDHKNKKDTHPKGMEDLEQDKKISRLKILLILERTLNDIYPKKIASFNRQY